MLNWRCCSVFGSTLSFSTALYEQYMALRRFCSVAEASRFSSAVSREKKPSLGNYTHTIPLSFLLNIKMKPLPSTTWNVMQTNQGHVLLKSGSNNWIRRKAKVYTISIAALRKDKVNKSVNKQISLGSSPCLAPGFSSRMRIRNCETMQRFHSSH